MWRVKLLRFHKCINIDGDVQYCLKVLLSECRRLGHVGVTLTVGTSSYWTATCTDTSCQTVMSSSPVTRHGVAEERFKLRFHESLFKVRRWFHLEDFQRLGTSMMRCASQKNSFCGFSTSDVGLYLMQSRVRVARRKQHKMCGIYPKKLPWNQQSFRSKQHTWLYMSHVSWSRPERDLNMDQQSFRSKQHAWLYMSHVSWSRPELISTWISLKLYTDLLLSLTYIWRLSASARDRLPLVQAFRSC